MVMLGPTASSSIRLVFDPLTSAVPGCVFGCEHWSLDCAVNHVAGGACWEGDSKP